MIFFAPAQRIFHLAFYLSSSYFFQKNMQEFQRISKIIK
ncbi:hypothetical protein STRCR_2186 [Streptococcus criceti HS-6]|uniref:Uncharacterized protein n=1 Tax=Streptococcus criceti HS-6 TaxID=873449 RepID=G5JSI6_STRCG|nr:hypothetical protein STRCR_2186 [Streptococcus criceti HS-6]